MAVRTVSVELKMKISDFEAAAAKAGLTTRALGDEFDGLGKKSDKFSTAKPTREMQNFSRVINSSLKDGKTGFQSIQTAIDDTKTHIANLRSQIRTGSGSTSLFGDLKQAQKDLRTLEGIFKGLGDEGSQAGTSWTKNFGKAAADLAPGVSTPVGLAVGVGVVAAASPFIVAGLTAAIAGGVGGGLIAAGAIIQHNNPVLQSAFAQLKTDAAETGKLATSALVTPFQEAILSADRFVTREGPTLAKLFSDLAPAIRPLEADLEHMGATLLPALDKAAQGFTKAIASPAVTSSLQALDNQLAGLFNTIGNHPQEIADGFRTIFTLINAGVAVVKGITEAYAAADSKLTQWHNDIQNWIDKQSGATQANKNFATSSDEVVQKEIAMAGGIDNYNKALAELNQQSQVAKDDLSSLATELGATKITADTLAGQMTDKLMAGMLGVDNATNNFNKSLVTVGDTIVAIGGHLTEHVKALKKTETGQQQETDAVLAAIQANLQVYDSQIAVGISAEDAAKAYDKNAASLDAQVRAAGHVPPAVQKLIDKYAHVPDKVNTIIAIQGLTDAIDNLNSTLLLLSHIDGFHAQASVTTTYYTKNKPHTGPLATNYNRDGGIYEHADTGLVRAHIAPATFPARYAYAEPQTGGEAFIPKLGNYGRSMSILSAAAGWYGARVVPNGGGSNGGTPVVVNLYASDPAGAALIQAIRLGVQGRGGDVVKVLTPR